MAEEKKKSQADKMFGSSPKLERDEESGKVAVKKKGKEDKAEGEDESGTGEAIPVEARHAMDRLSLHHKHENEHHAHKGGDKKEMHSRHQDEMAALHKRHEKEYGKKE